MRPKVSVLMGIFNCAPFLQEALDSLYAQTFQDFEIVLCEDGSSDATYDIAKRNAEIHPQIKLIKNASNQGLNKALNNCIAIAEGEYFARMDGDDISMPHRFEKEVKFLDEHSEYAIVSGPMEYFDENGTFLVGKGHGEPQVKDFPKGTPFCHAPCMVRREAYEAVGGYSVDEKLLRVEDYHLWIKMYAKGFRGYNLSEPLYKMRDDRNALARRKWKGAINEFRVKNFAVSSLGLSFYYRILSLRPILVYLLPQRVYMYLHRKRS